MKSRLMGQHVMAWAQGNRCRILVTLEPEFWEFLESEAAGRGLTVDTITQDISAASQGSDLAGAIRVWALQAAQTVPTINDGSRPVLPISFTKFIPGNPRSERIAA